MPFQIDDEIVLTRRARIQDYLDTDYSPEEFFNDRDLAFVVSVHEDGSVNEYSYATYFDVDEDGDEIELDFPIPSSEISTWNPNDEEPEEEWQWVTLQMLKDLKHSTNGLDSICRKVLYLHRKHNNYHGSAFQFKGV